MKVTDYKIVSDNHEAAVEQQVRDLLKQGYEPLGGVQFVAPVIEGAVAPAYAQAMIKKSE